MKEPILVIVAGGTSLVQAIIQVLLAFHVPLTVTQVSALTTLASVLLAAIARAMVVPTSQLPPGAAAAIADAKLANKANLGG
jgi:hypothetical protein